MATAFRRSPLSTADLSWMARLRPTRPAPLGNPRRPSTPDVPPCVADSRCSIGGGDAESQQTGEIGCVFPRIIRGESLRIQGTPSSFQNHMHLHLKQLHLL